MGLGVAVEVGVTGFGVGPAPEPSRAVQSSGTWAEAVVVFSFTLPPHAPINTTGIIRSIVAIRNLISALWLTLAG